MTIPAAGPLPAPSAVPALHSPAPVQAPDEGDFAEAMHRAVLAILGGAVGSPRSAPSAPPVPAPSTPGGDSELDDAPEPTERLPIEPEGPTETLTDARIEAPRDTGHEAEAATQGQAPGQGVRVESGHGVPRPVSPAAPPAASTPPAAARGTAGETGTATPDVAVPKASSRFADLPAVGLPQGAAPGRSVSLRKHAVSAAAGHPIPTAEQVPTRGRTGHDAGAARGRQELAEPSLLPGEDGTTEGTDTSFSTEESATMPPFEGSPHPLHTHTRTGEVAGAALPPPFREIVSGPSSPGIPLREERPIAPRTTSRRGGPSQHGVETGTAMPPAPEAASAPSVAGELRRVGGEGLDGIPPHGAGPDRTPRSFDTPTDGRTSSAEVTLRHTADLTPRSLTDLGLSSARAVLTAWWEGSASPRAGAVPPPASARLRPSTPHAVSAEVALAASPVSTKIPVVATDAPGPTEPVIEPGVPPAFLVASTVEGGRSASTPASEPGPGAAHPGAAPSRGSPGDQMALTLRQDDGTAVTIRVLVRGDRVEATIIDRGPPQVPVGSRETATLHQALERHGFREVQVMVQHVPSGDREPHLQAPDSRRSTDSPQDRQQHSRRQDDEGFHRQGRSHQRSPRERER